MGVGGVPIMKISPNLAEKIRMIECQKASDKFDRDLLDSLTRQALGDRKPRDPKPATTRAFTEEDWAKHGPRRQQ